MTHAQRIRARRARKRRERERRRYDAMPFVCPGCYSVASPCLPGCPDGRPFGRDADDEPMGVDGPCEGCDEWASLDEYGMCSDCGEWEEWQGWRTPSDASDENGDPMPWENA